MTDLVDKIKAATTEAEQHRKGSGRDGLIALAESDYVIGRTEDERTYLVPHTGPNVALFSGAAKADLARRHLSNTGKSVGRSPLDEAWMTVEGLAHDSDKVSLPMRVARIADRLVIDLGDTTGRAVVVDAEGWQVVDRSPVTFRRSRTMLALPAPVPGGDVDEMFDLLNVAIVHRDLFAAWHVSALFENLPHPAVVYRGEQGAAKTSTARCTTRLLDPCLAATQKPPKQDDDWAMTCSARWVIAVDNVSNVSEWWSDALCRTVTGDGWLRRQLYSDDDVVATSYRRCIILNGITLGATLRPDLAERLIVFDLERPREWLTEAEVDGRLDDMRPRVLGALLNRAAATLAALSTAPLPRDLRMADFAQLLAAYDMANGTQALDAYRAQVETAFAEALDSDPLASAVVTYMADRPSWRGLPSELLDRLKEWRPDKNDDSKHKGDESWPANAQRLSIALARSTPALRRVGIHVSRPPRTSKGQEIRLDRRTGDANDAGDATALLVVSEQKKGETEASATIGSDASHASLATPVAPCSALPAVDEEFGEW